MEDGADDEAARNFAWADVFKVLLVAALELDGICTMELGSEAREPELDDAEVKEDETEMAGDEDEVVRDSSEVGEVIDDKDGLRDEADEVVAMAVAELVGEDDISADGCKVSEMSHFKSLESHHKYYRMLLLVHTRTMMRHYLSYLAL